MKTFTLKLKITGVCLIAPSTGKKSLHVFMPAGLGESHLHAGPVEGQHGHDGASHSNPRPPRGGQDTESPDGMPVHVARLLFNKAYGVQGSTRLEEGDDPYEKVPMEHQFLDLCSLPSTSDFEPTIPADIWDLSKQTKPKKKKMKKKLLEEPAAVPELLSGLTIARGEADGTTRGAVWSVGQEVRERALALHWVVKNVQGSSLTLVFKSLNEDDPRDPITLYPVGNELSLEIWHTPEDEIGLPPNYDDAGNVSAHHMARLYDLFDGYVQAHGRAPLPTFVRIPDDLRGSSVASEGKESRTGSRITCFPAKGDGDDIG